MPRYQSRRSLLERLLDGYEHPDKALSPEAVGALLHQLVDDVLDLGSEEQLRAALIKAISRD
jgi:hypothetical protein